MHKSRRNGETATFKSIDEWKKIQIVGIPYEGMVKLSKNENLCGSK